MRECGLFYGHIFSCPACRPRSDTYCEAGQNQRIRYVAEFIATLPHLEDRRRWLDQMRERFPGRGTELEQLVTEMFAANKAAKNTRILEAGS